MARNIRVRIASLTALVALLGVALFASLTACTSKDTLKVGFIYDNDETTPYSYNFYLAQKALQETYGDRISILMFSNVLDENMRATAEKLSERGCRIIFTNSYGDILSLARKYPEVEFCQVSSNPLSDATLPDNYHTFKGEIYQGRYLSGVIAGIKLRRMIEEGKVNADKPLVGFVAAFPYPEVISGYTAFLLGVRSVVDTATLRVKYTGSWSNYTIERACATELLDEGCLIISQHTDTIGPAIACEDYYAHDAYHVGYNIDMSDVAPGSSLTSARIDWTPYMLGAIDAVLSGKRIEDVVPGHAHGKHDISGGLSDGWIELTPLNEALLPKDATSTLEQVSKRVADGSRQVFYGPYKGTNPHNANDTIDLSMPFMENEDSSIPSFDYLLDDIVTIEE